MRSDDITSITHKNHYVPQFYLKNWSRDGKKIWVYSLLVPHHKIPYWQEKSIDYTACWNDFYTRCNGEQEADEFEKWFNSEFETPTEPIIKKLIQGKAISKQEHIILTHYIMAQDMRVPARVNFVLGSAKRALSNFLDSFSFENVKKEDIINCYNRNENDDLLPINIHIDREKSEIELNTFVGKSVYLYALKSLLTSTVKKVEHYKWRVVQASEGISFPTSDDPVIRLNFNNKFDYDFNGGWGKKHSNIIMPISPKCLLFTEIGVKTKMTNLDCSKEWSEFFRKIIIEHAYRFVYADSRQRGMLSINPRRVNKKLYQEEQKTMSGWHEYNLKAEQEILEKN